MKVVNENKEEALMGYFAKWNAWKEKFPSLDNKDVVSWLYDMTNQYVRKGKEVSKFQIQVYIKYFDQYCQYNKVSNPSELVKEDIDDRNHRVMTYLNFLLKGNEEEIKKLGFKNRPSEVSIINQIQGKVKSFYSNRGSNISVGIESLSSGANRNELRLEKSIIKAIQNKLETNQYRLICKFQSQTGLRIDDILNNLTSGKYSIEAFQMNKEKTYYFIRNFKTAKEQVVINFMFFTEELSQLIESSYPEEEITKLDLKKLFLTRKNTRINQNDYLRRVKKIVKDLGFDQNIKTHSFRKYFRSQLVDCEDLDMEFREHLLGHKGQNLSQAYNTTLQDINWVFKNWKKAMNHICVDCITVDNTSKEIIEHKKQIANLELENKHLYEDIAQMKLTMNKMDKMMNKFFGEMEKQTTEEIEILQKKIKEVRDSEQ